MSVRKGIDRTRAARLHRSLWVPAMALQPVTFVADIATGPAVPFSEHDFHFQFILLCPEPDTADIVIRA
jgi:hypothetical protein